MNISVVVAYAPTEVAGDDVKNKFYNTLMSVITDIPAQDVKLLLGDFNAKITNYASQFKGTISKHSLHDVNNNNGSRLLDFCTLNQLVVGGTLFHHKDIHKGIWKSPN